MELILGRDQNHQRLNVFVDGQQIPKAAGQPGSVPQSVSRQHCSVQDCGSGKFLVRNLNPNNVTYVNGMAVMQQLVTPADRIELGGERYQVSWEMLKPFFPMDVAHLATIWQEYYDETNRMMISEKRFNALRGILPVFTMGALVMKMAGIGGDGALVNISYGFAIVISLFFTAKAWIDAKKLPERREELQRWFMANYRCPNPDCNRFLGNREFELVMEDGACPKCKTKFVIDQ